MFSVILKVIKAKIEAESLQEKSVYARIYNALRNAIESKHIPEGTLMPPTRLLSEQLNVARSTVVKVYNLLVDNKLLNPKPGSGYTVAAIDVTENAAERTKIAYPDVSRLGASFLQNSHLLINSNVEGVAFTPGIPPIDIFPIGQWQKLTNLYWRNIRSSDLNYSISSGIDSLKENIAHYLLLTRQIKCDPKQVIIVSGSLQSLYLLGTVLINEGDLVYLENPTFPNVISIFKSLRADIHTVEVDADGVNADTIQTTQQAPKLIHVTPSNHYPYGMRMTEERRLALLKWAAANNAYIIENDYEHEINNWHKPIKSIYSLDKEQRTIYLGTFNRTLHPSIRLGYMILPPHLLPVVKALQMHSHRFVPQSVQAVMTDFIKNNHIYKHLRNVIEEAEERKKLFEALFEAHFKGALHLNNTQCNSFHVVTELPTGYNDLKFAAAFQDKGVIVHPLSKCYIDNPLRQGFIMGYSCVNKGFMAQYIARMATAYHTEAMPLR